MTINQVDRAELVRLMKQSFSFANRALTYIRYKFCAKIKLGSNPTGRTVDCSGYVRWLLYGATHGRTTMPDGSWNQRVWCETLHFARCPYSDCGQMDSRLRIAFIAPQPGRVGHVWLCINGKTIESYGGHGAGRRLWNTPKLLTATSCFVLTDPLP